MKNILLIMPYGSVGGMERLALNFYHYYKKQGFKVKAVKFIGLASDIIFFDEDEYLFSTKDLGAFSPLNRLLFYITSPFKLRKIIKKEQITHSIAFGDMANIFSTLTFTNEKKIGSIHALKSVELNSKSVFTKVIKCSYKTIYKKFNKVVCISYAIKKDLIEQCQYKFDYNLEVIYNPHDIESLRDLAKEPFTDTLEIKIFKKDVILFLGRLSIQKSPWHLINAFSLLKNNEQINLVFIGDGDARIIEYLNELIIKHNLSDQVYFLGRKSNPYKYLSKSRLLALTSHYEGTPNVIVEAMALRVPVVSSNCTGGIGELMSLSHVESSSNNIQVEAGIITPNLYKGIIGIPNTCESISKEEESFARALNFVLTDKSIKYKLEEASYKLTSKFNLNHVCKQYLN